MHNSRQLQESSTLQQAGVTNGATLSVVLRVRGGGGDGGSTGAESRSCYLEMYAEKKPDKVGLSGFLASLMTVLVGPKDRLGCGCTALQQAEGGCWSARCLLARTLNVTVCWTPADCGLVYHSWLCTFGLCPCCTSC